MAFRFRPVRYSGGLTSVDIVTGILDTCHYYRYCLFSHNDELLRTVSDFLDPDARKSGRRVTIVTGNGKALKREAQTDARRHNVVLRLVHKIVSEV